MSPWFRDDFELSLQYLQVEDFSQRDLTGYATRLHELFDADFAVRALAGDLGTRARLERLRPEGISISWATVGEIYEGAFGRSGPQAAWQPIASSSSG